jgi:type IV secretory pathway TrbD component
MSERRPLSRHERTIIVTGILCIVLTLVLMQLWLLTATMNAWLGGDESVVWPAALASLACFLLNAGLLWYLFKLDR